MDDLETLSALLGVTDEAQELVSEFGKPERLRLIFLEMRSRVREERRRLSHHRKGTRFDLCLIGILEELYFLDKSSWEDVVGLDSKLARIREEIERTILEIKANRRIM